MLQIYKMVHKLNSVKSLCVNTKVVSYNGKMKREIKRGLRQGG